MFSATCNILPGSKTNPAFVTLNPNIKGETDTQTHKWKASLWIPGVSTLAGLVLALTGTIHAIVHLACAVFDAKNSEHHLNEAKLGGINVLYGVVAMIPIVGNIAILIKDLIAANHFCEIAEKQSEKGKICLFFDGVKVASKSEGEALKLLQSTSFTVANPPGFWDQVAIIQTP